jgi:hypothetical protein
MQDRSIQTQHRAQRTLAGHRILLFGLHQVVFAASSQNAACLSRKPAAKETWDRMYVAVMLLEHSPRSSAVDAVQMASGLEVGARLDHGPQTAPNLA